MALNMNNIHIMLQRSMRELDYSLEMLLSADLINKYDACERVAAICKHNRLHLRTIDLLQTMAAAKGTDGWMEMRIEMQQLHEWMTPVYDALPKYRQRLSEHNIHNMHQLFHTRRAEILKLVQGDEIVETANRRFRQVGLVWK